MTETENMEVQATDRKRRLRKNACSLIGRCGVGRRFKRNTFDNFSSDAEPRAYGICREFAHTFPECSVGIRGLYLHSEVTGTGKSHLGHAIVNCLVNKGVSTVWTTLEDHFARIKQGWGGDKEAASLVCHAKRAPLLVIDDMHQDIQINNWRQSVFCDLINERYNGEIPIVITSNLDYAQLEQKCSLYAVDRIREMCRMIAFSSKESFRSRIAANTTTGGE